MHRESLTVLLPVRDEELHIGAVLGDVLASLTQDDHILVVDDGSSDGTSAMVSSWMERYPQIRMIRTVGIGLVGALTLGINEASDAWIARADADDRYPVNRLKVQRSAITSGVAAITGDYRVTGPDDGGTIPCALSSPFVELSLLHPQRFPHPGVMFHRDAVLEAGGYRKEEHPAEDLGLWIRLAHVGQFVGVPQVVVDWRMNPTSITHTSQVAQRAMTSNLLSQFALPTAKTISADDVEDELRRYVGTQHSHERAVLLGRDLWAGWRLGVPKSALRPVFTHLGLKPGTSFKAFRGLAREARNRQQFRESM